MSASAFALLHPGVQRAVHRMAWKKLQPIQVQAIEALLGSTGHLLISAQTAGGKTEAAFLPVISQLASEQRPSIQALYIGPLIALINDQFGRLERLCGELEIPVHRWHGGATASEKKRLRDRPSGILLITPESLESNFINFGRYLQRMYSELQFVVIDELHSFLSNVRGVHLRSLLNRLVAATGRRPRLIGLSATLGDLNGAQAFLAPEAPETVILVRDKGARKQIQLGIRAYVTGVRVKEKTFLRFSPEEALQIAESIGSEPVTPEQPLKLLSVGKTYDESEPDELNEIADDIFTAFLSGKNLVFGNSKQSLEVLADRLHRRVARERVPDPFIVHHGSLSRELRDEAEEALKQEEHVTALCSSTLEMGIDIGAIRRVGQLDPPWSVASLVQRLGRSGRREGEASILRLYVRPESPHPESTLTDLLFPDLLRAVALVRLMVEKWLEPHDGKRLHLSTLVHQILSCLRQTGGAKAETLYVLLVKNGAFANVSREQFVGVLRSLGQREVIEQLPTGEVILAPIGERITADWGFYAAFASSEEMAVRWEEREIGKLQSSLVPPVGENIILAGRRWEVAEIDPRLKIVFVQPSRGGKAPLFRGAGGEIHGRVVTEMRSVLVESDIPAYLNAAGATLLRAARTIALRTKAAATGILVSATGVRWYPWLGTRGLHTLQLHAKLAGIVCRADELSLQYPKLTLDAWRDHLAAIAGGTVTALQLARHEKVKHAEKFDDLLSVELLDAAIAHDRLDLSEAKQAATIALRELTSN